MSKQELLDYMKETGFRPVVRHDRVVPSADIGPIMDKIDLDPQMIDEMVNVDKTLIWLGSVAFQSQFKLAGE